MKTQTHSTAAKAVNLVISRTAIEILERRVLLVAVPAMSFDYNTAPHGITYDFAEYVEPSLDPSDFHLENLLTGEALETSLAYGSDDVATFAPTGFPNGLFPKANFQSTIFADAVQGANQQPMTDDADFPFFFMPADANHDRQANTLDFNILMSNWFQSPRSFNQGDFNYDSTVNNLDWDILAANFNSTLAFPPQPNSIEVSSGTGQNELAWDLGEIPSDADGIRIQRSTDAQNFDIYVSLPDPTLKGWTDDAFGLGLAPGTRFWYRARAYGGASGGTTYTPKDDGITVMLPPENVQATVISPSQIVLTWDDVTSNEVKYKIEVTQINGGTWIIDNVPANADASGSYTVSSNLLPNTSYTFRMLAVGPARESIWTLPTAPATTPIAVQPPTSLVAGTPSFTSVPLSWSYNTTGHTGFHIYNSPRTGESFGNFVLAGTVGAQDRNFTVTGLEEGLEYRFLVAAAHGTVQSTGSNVVTATTKLVAPASLNVLQNHETELVLGWSGGSTYRDGYLLEASVDEAPYKVLGLFGSNQFSYTLSGLAGSSQCAFRLVATRGAEASAAYEIDATTEFPEPTQFAAQVNSSREVNLTWADNAATEDGYVIEYSKYVPPPHPNPVFTIQLPANSKGFTLVGLKPESEYTFTVRATRLAGQINSDSSPPLTRTTPADPPPHPPLPGPYKVWVGSRRHGTSSYSSTGELSVSLHDWIEAASPSAAVLQVVSGSITTHYPDPAPNGHDETRTFPNSFMVYWDDPGSLPVEHEALRWDADSCAYVGQIGMEDWSDNDYDDQVWSVAVRP